MCKLNDKQQELLAKINGFIDAELTRLKLYQLKEEHVIEVLEKLIKMRKEYIESLIPNPEPSESIKEFSKRAVVARDKVGKDLAFAFNGVDITVTEDDNWKSIYWRYHYKLKN